MTSGQPCGIHSSRGGTVVPTALTVVLATSADLLEQWRAVHNRVVPPSALTTQEVAERARRNRLSLGFDDGVLVGNATVRARVADLVTVIVRVLPAHRRRGLGRAYLDLLLDQVRRDPLAAGATVGTVVLAANVDGLAAALRWGFVETDRYVADGAPYVDLALPRPLDPLEPLSPDA